VKVRQNLYLDRKVTDALEALAAGRGGNKSRIVNDALAAWLARRASSQLDDMLKLRLDRMSRDQARIARDLDVLLESFALFVRYQLLVTAPLPDADTAALAIGRDRFEKFIGQVGRQLASGKRTLGETEPAEMAA
jgi:hypothetical protein